MVRKTYEREIKTNIWRTFAAPLACEVFCSAKGLKSSSPRAALLVCEATEGSWNTQEKFLNELGHSISKASHERGRSFGHNNLRRMDFPSLQRRDFHCNLPWFNVPSVKGGKVYFWVSKFGRGTLTPISSSLLSATLIAHVYVITSRRLDFRGIATRPLHWRARRQVYCFEPRVILHQETLSLS